MGEEGRVSMKYGEGGGGVFEGGTWYPNAHFEHSKQSPSDDNLLWKEMSSSFYKEQETFIKA